MIGLSGRKLLLNTVQQIQFAPKGEIWERMHQTEPLDKELLVPTLFFNLIIGDITNNYHSLFGLY